MHERWCRINLLLCVLPGRTNLTYRGLPELKECSSASTNMEHSSRARRSPSARSLSGVSGAGECWSHPRGLATDPNDCLALVSRPGSALLV